MRHIVCSVFDKQSRQFSAPFTSFTSGTATRDFARAVRDSKGMVDKFPADYELYYIGSMDTDTGVLFCEAIPELLAKGADYLEV